MVRSARPFLVALTAIYVGGCTIERADVRTPSGEPPEADTTRVRKAIEAVALAFETGDLTPLDTIYHEDVTVYEDGRVEQGWLQYRDQYLLPEIEALTQRQLHLEDITVRLSGATAWATCRYTLHALRDGEPVLTQGLRTMIFRRVAGRWRLVHSHSSTGAPGGGP